VIQRIRLKGTPIQPTWSTDWKFTEYSGSRVKVVIFRAVKSKKKLKGHRVDNSGGTHHRWRSLYKQPGAQAITIPESPRANAHKIRSVDQFVSQSPVQIFWCRKSAFPSLASTHRKLWTLRLLQPLKNKQLILFVDCISYSFALSQIWQWFFTRQYLQYFHCTHTRKFRSGGWRYGHADARRGD
jgi:hypothetical protein